MYNSLPVHTHDPARAAVPTLGAIVLRECLLHRVIALPSVTNAFYCGNFPILRRVGAHQTLKEKSVKYIFYLFWEEIERR